MPKADIQYFQVIKVKQQYRGERYFAFSANSCKVVQVCLSTGTEFRRGRANTVGLYMIDRLTFVSNYMAMGYLAPVSKTIFTKKFSGLVEMMSFAVNVEVHLNTQSPK